MKRLFKITPLLCLIGILSACSTMRSGHTNDYFLIEKSELIDHAKDVINDNNLRILEEIENDDGSHEITVFRQERRKYTSREQAINRIRIVFTPDKDNSGFFVSVQQPGTHAMARSASTVDYRSRILRSLNERIPPAENENDLEKKS